MRQKKQVICRFLMFALRQLHRCKRQVDLAEVIPHFKVNTKKHLSMKFDYFGIVLMHSLSTYILPSFSLDKFFIAYFSLGRPPDLLIYKDHDQFDLHIER